MAESKLDELLLYVSDDGVDKLYSDFLRGLNNKMIDGRKSYSHEEKVMYFYRDTYSKTDIDKVTGITDESYPYSFDQHITRTINYLAHSYLKWLDSIFLTESVEKLIAIILDHKNKIANRLELMSKENYASKKAKLVYQRLKEKESYLSKTPEQNKSALLEDFSEKYSMKANSSKETIKSYLEVWISCSGLSYPRAKAIKKLKDKFDLPSDATLKYWEEKWTDFFNSRTRN